MSQRILMLTPFFSPNLGGVETHLDDLTAYLQRQGVAVTVITYQPLTTKGRRAPLFERKENSLSIVRLPWIKGLFYRLESRPLLQFPYLFTGIFAIGFIYLLIKGKDTSIVHGHGLAAGVATLILSKMFRKKSVVSLHTIYKFSERPALASIVAKILGPVDRLLVLSRGCEADLAAIGIPREKISVYTCWVDNKDSFVQRDRNTCREKLQLPHGKFIALFIGRLSPEKGIATVIETAMELSKDGVVSVLVGDGPMREDVRKAALRDPNIIWHGNVENRKLHFYYGAANVLLFGSVDQDYYGRVTMEALSCGLPVILPDSTAYFGKPAKVRVHFPEGQIGFMVPPITSSVLAALKNLYSKPEVLSKMSSAARDFAIEHFGDKNAQVFLNCYVH